VGELIHFLIGVPEVMGATTIFIRRGGSFVVKPRARRISSRFGCMTLA
jgi:hypothetical protein